MYDDSCFKYQEKFSEVNSPLNQILFDFKQNDRTVAAGDINVSKIYIAINIMTIRDLIFSYHFGKSDKNQRLSRP